MRHQLSKVLSGKLEHFTIRRAVKGRFHGIDISGYHQGTSIAMSRCRVIGEGGNRSSAGGPVLVA
jgi:hypothetical protein